MGGREVDLPLLCMPPSSWLQGVSLQKGGACERRGLRQERGGEQGSEGGARTRKCQEGRDSKTREEEGVVKKDTGRELWRLYRGERGVKGSGNQGEASGER